MCNKRAEMVKAQDLSADLLDAFFIRNAFFELSLSVA